MNRMNKNISLFSSLARSIIIALQKMEFLYPSHRNLICWIAFRVPISACFKAFILAM